MPMVVPSWPSHTKRYAPPTLKSISQTGIVQPGGPRSQRLTSSGLVQASKTSLRGALKTRVIAISRSEGVVTLNFPVSIVRNLSLAQHGRVAQALACVVLVIAAAAVHTD